jgi:hypothetical protein
MNFASPDLRFIDAGCRGPDQGKEYELPNPAADKNKQDKEQNKPS